MPHYQAPQPAMPATDADMGGGGGGSGTVALKGWNPSTPYLTSLKKKAGSNIKEAYRVYLIERTDYESSPAFYFDVSEYFMKTLECKKLALRILTNIVELGADDQQLFRIIGYKLHEWGEAALAISVFERVLRIAPGEPQSHRDLALVLGEGQEERAVRLLWAVVCGTKWDQKYAEIELTALTEMNRLLWLAKRRGVKVAVGDDRMDAFIAPVDVDLRISMAWDTDETDIDLHVIEPTREECYYGNRNTALGGTLSRDFTRGYGPEEYMCYNAAKGVYKVSAKYFASHQQNMAGATTILLTIFNNYCRENEERRFVTVRLTQCKEMISVGDVHF
eukprot:TRINITY_DN418_c0_g1_i7.p1 TRINITY_DN418_c0_g1~~TRINITY_DN418_c0_g1_i7.p1  ORF type:complete len:361 (-),score=125.05 TRINITY_DN418_c0_g1_i7:131-1132(-)